MDFNVTELQEILKKTARDFLTQECTLTKLKEIAKDERGYSSATWDQMRDLGWLGVAFPGQYGGADGNFLDLMTLCEEIGYASLPSPFLPSVVLAGLTILDAGSEDQKKQFLPGLAEGKFIFTFGLPELSVSYDPAAIQLTATAGNADYKLSGTKLFVPYAHVADHMICAARTSAAKEGVTLFIVDIKSKGITVNLLKSISTDRFCEVIFNDVAVDKKDILGAVDKAGDSIRKGLQRAAIAKCAEMTGGAQRSLELAVSYSKERQQFGKFIGTFQIIQHQCADIALDVKTSSLLTYNAASLISDGLPCAKEVSMAKAWVNEAYERVTYFATKVHGAISLTADHAMPLYFKHAKASEPVYGDSDFHREIVAKAIGL